VYIWQVLFLHGFTGSANDGLRVRRDIQLRATRVRFCALDRPGNGYSEGYSTEGPEQLHFGQIAEATEAVLRAFGINGDLILMFHSLGSYWGMALAHQVRDICNVLQCVAVCCSVLQCVAVCCSLLQRGMFFIGELPTLIHGAGASGACYFECQRHANRWGCGYRRTYTAMGLVERASTSSCL